MALNPDAFKIEIDPETKVTIGDQHSADNFIGVIITNKGAEVAKLRATLSIKCGATVESLLSGVETEIKVTTDPDDTLSATSATDSRSWQTSARGIVLNAVNTAGNTLSFSLSGFDSNTFPGGAVITVTLEEHPGKVWSQLRQTTLTVQKTAEQLADPKIHFFTVDPDYVLHAGDTPVAVSFYATGFDSLVLFRNNQEVQNWPKTSDGVKGLFSDKPSITTVYRLEGKTAGKDTDTRYLTVQVISPGWNQIALPQGYPTRLFVSADFTPGDANQPSKRLYGIFIDSGGTAALYSSATGVEDWRLEPGVFPQEMAMSPGVAFDDKLWLIGGSCVDPNQPGSEVWCYQKVDGSDERDWQQVADFPGSARMGHACVVFPPSTGGGGGVAQELWLMGGYNNGLGAYFNDVWKFQNGKWDQLSPATWKPRLMHAAVSFQPPTPEGEDTPPAEVYVYGGAAEPSPPSGLRDLWVTSDGRAWKELRTQADRGIVPPPGPPLAAAVVSVPQAGPTQAGRLLVAGSFLETENGNRIVSWTFELKRLSRVWQQNPVVDGWEQFEGGFFYMQAVAFNGFVFVWSLIPSIPTSTPPKLNILIPR